jgi:hypothetical protein
VDERTERRPLDVVLIVLQVTCPSLPSSLPLSLSPSLFLCLSLPPLHRTINSNRPSRKKPKRSCNPFPKTKPRYMYMYIIPCNGAAAHRTPLEASTQVTKTECVALHEARAAYVSRSTLVNVCNCGASETRDENRFRSGQSGHGRNTRIHRTHGISLATYRMLDVYTPVATIHPDPQQQPCLPGTCWGYAGNMLGVFGGNPTCHVGNQGASMPTILPAGYRRRGTVRVHTIDEATPHQDLNPLQQYTV